MDARSVWLASSRHRLNSSKMQLIWLSGGRRLTSIDWCLVPDTFLHIIVSSWFWDLGSFYKDQKFSFSQHINQLTHNCYYELHQLQVISSSISHNATVILIHAFGSPLVEFGRFALWIN